MKFQAHMVRTEERCIEVFADDPNQVMALLKAAHPGFSVTEVTELHEGGPGQTHTVMTNCSACGATIWDGDHYIAGEGSDLCMACAEEAEKA